MGMEKERSGEVRRRGKRQGVGREVGIGDGKRRKGKGVGIGSQMSGKLERKERKGGNWEGEGKRCVGMESGEEDMGMGKWGMVEKWERNGKREVRRRLEIKCEKRSGNWKERGKKGRNKVESWEG